MYGCERTQSHCAVEAGSMKSVEGNDGQERNEEEAKVRRNDGSPSASSGCYFDAEEGVDGESEPGVVRIVT